MGGWTCTVFESGLDDSRKAVGPVVAVAGDQPDGFATALNAQTVAVILDFADPVGAVRHGCGGRGQAELKGFVHKSHLSASGKKWSPKVAAVPPRRAHRANDQAPQQGLACRLRPRNRAKSFAKITGAFGKQGDVYFFPNGEVWHGRLPNMHGRRAMICLMGCTAVTAEVAKKPPSVSADLIAKLPPHLARHLGGPFQPNDMSNTIVDRIYRGRRSAPFFSLEIGRDGSARSPSGFQPELLPELLSSISRAASSTVVVEPFRAYSGAAACPAQPDHLATSSIALSIAPISTRPACTAPMVMSFGANRRAVISPLWSHLRECPISRKQTGQATNVTAKMDFIFVPPRN